MKKRFLASMLLISFGAFFSGCDSPEASSVVKDADADARAEYREMMAVAEAEANGDGSE